MLIKSYLPLFVGGPSLRLKLELIWKLIFLHDNVSDNGELLNKCFAVLAGPRGYLGKKL